tara:strand:- start:1452 stop:2516 length:1065 start_codon:yes stop_codon:yes gene_type:complete
MHFSSSSLKKDMIISQKISNIESGMLQLRLYEKDFLARKKNIYIEQFDDQVLRLQLSIKTLKKELKRFDISGEDSIILSHLLTNYQGFFNTVVNIQKRIGFDPNSGSHSKLRNAARSAEEAIGNSVLFLKMMLEVRNSEKDYMLLLDNSYIAKFNEDFDKLYNNVQKSFLIEVKKKLILSSLDAYKTAFLSLAGDQQVLGYHDDQAFQKALNQSAQKVQLAQIRLVKKTNQAISEYMNSIMQLTYLLFILTLLISIFVGWIVSRNIINAIAHIKKSIMKITESNDLTIIVTTNNNDELSDMAKAFNYMLSNFRNLLASVKKLETNSNTEQKTEKLTDNSFWSDFIYEELSENGS